MDQPPIVVPISESRRDIANIIQRVWRSDAAVYVTQNGYATAVRPSRNAFERPRSRAHARGAVEGAPARPDSPPRIDPRVHVDPRLHEVDPDLAALLTGVGLIPTPEATDGENPERWGQEFSWPRAAARLCSTRSGGAADGAWAPRAGAKAPRRTGR